MILIYSLAFVVLSSFPVLGAGVQVIGGDNILHVQSFYFAIMVFGMVTALGIINELRKPVGGIYNTDALLSVMTQGLEEELELRISGLRTEATEESPTVDFDFEIDNLPDDNSIDNVGIISEAAGTTSFNDQEVDVEEDYKKISLKARISKIIKGGPNQ